jgi:streptogramin lyase
MVHRFLGAGALAVTIAGCSAGAVAPTAPPAQSARAPIGGVPLNAVRAFDDAIANAKNLKQRYISEPDIYSGTDIAVGKSNTLWIGDQCTGIVKVTGTGAATVYTYNNPPTGCSDPISLTPGIGGDVWFVDPSLNSIGRIAPRGNITLYGLPSVPSCNVDPSVPNGIVEGPDGNMWFTTQNGGDILCPNYYSSAIGRITSSGQITYYYTSPQNTDSYSPKGYITVGAGGAMYFPADDPSNHLVVGSVTTGGSISFSGEVTCPGSALCTADTDGIVDGPDGNIWMTDYYDNVIIRYTGGSEGFSVFQAPDGQNPRRITNGPDGAMWFTTTALALGRVSTGGTITFYDLSAQNVKGYGGITQRLKSLWFVIDPSQLGVATP